MSGYNGKIERRKVTHALEFRTLLENALCDYYSIPLVQSFHVKDHFGIVSSTSVNGSI